MQHKYLPFYRIGFQFDDSFELIEENELLDFDLDPDKVHFALRKNDRIIPFYKEDMDYQYESFHLFRDNRLGKRLTRLTRSGYKYSNKVSFYDDDEDDETAISYQLTKDNKNYLFITCHGSYSIVETNDFDNDPLLEEIVSIYRSTIYLGFIGRQVVWPIEIGVVEDNTFLYVGKDDNPYYYFFFCRINDVWYDEISIHYGCKVIWKMVSDDDTDLERVYFPVDLERIEEHAFSNCSKLESIILKDGLKYLGKYAFAYCLNVTQVELPSSLEEIDDFCFDSLESVTSFRFHGTLAQWHPIKKGKGWIGGDCDFDIVCDDGVIPIKTKERYCVHDRRNDSVKHFVVKDQIDEMVGFDKNNKIINCSYLYTSLDEYLSRYPKRFPKDKITSLLYGMIRLFVSTCGICTHEQYLLYLNITRKTEADISYEKYRKLMTDDIYSPKLEEAAFDTITCELPLVMRFYISIIGVALMSCNNKLPQSIYSLVDEIIGPMD